MTNEALFYKRSGKFSSRGILVALPIMGVVVFLISYLYAYLLMLSEGVFVHLNQEYIPKGSVACYNRSKPPLTQMPGVIQALLIQPVFS